MNKIWRRAEVYCCVYSSNKHLGFNSCNSKKKLNGKQTDNLVINYLMN